MKSNIIKYIFAVVVIGLVVYSAYILYGKKNNEQKRIEPTVVEDDTEIINNIRIPVVNFDTINPILSKNQSIQNISRLIYEPLLNIDKNYKIEFCLAKEWTKVNATSYIIKIKDNIKWQDGNILTTKDVQFTIDRLKEGNTNSIYANNVIDVIGVEVIDDSTIKINLSKEVPFFEYNLTFPIMSYRYFENEDFINTSKNNHPVGTGRFKVTIENGNVVLKQNQNWWNMKDNPTKLTEIYIIKYSDMGEVYNAFKMSNIDLITTENFDVENYIGTIGYNIKEYNGRKLDFIAFNCENDALSQEVRQAISYVIDKQNIVSGIYKDKYKISSYVLDYGSYLYEENQVNYEYNIDKARQILEENGWNYTQKKWRKTKDYKSLKLSFDLVVNSENEKRVEVAENIKNSLENLGIKINIIKANSSQYAKYLQNKNYDILLTGTYTSYSPDLSTYFGTDNLSKFSNDNMQALISEISNITDEKVLKEKYNQIAQIYNKELPYIFLYNSNCSFIYSSKLMGEINPNSYNIYEGIGSWYRQ